MHWKTEEDLFNGLICGIIASLIVLFGMMSCQNELRDVKLNPKIFGERK